MKYTGERLKQFVREIEAQNIDFASLRPEGKEGDEFFIAQLKAHSFGLSWYVCDDNGPVDGPHPRDEATLAAVILNKDMNEHPCGTCRFHMERDSGRTCWKFKMEERPGVDTITDCGGWAEKPIPKEAILVEPAPSAANIEILRQVLLRARWDDSGGFQGYKGDGQWRFVTGGLPQATPEEWTALMELAGIEPDKIETVGSCETCRFSVDGHNRGYGAPCVVCSQPYHDMWEAAS